MRTPTGLPASALPTVLLATALLAPRAAPAARPAAPPPSPTPSLSERLHGLTFRCIGPYRGGRVTTVTGVRGKPLTFYMGATGGGVFRTTDGGATWVPLTDKDLKTGSVGAVAVAESDANVIYAGMGEAPIRGNVSHGDGVWKSTDAGKSWKNTGLTDTRQISKVIVHPKDANVVWVAAQGHVWGPNEERGVFKSTDGGASWRQVLSVDEKTGASDLSIDPSNPRILFAGFWQVHRKPWTLESGGPGGGVFRTTDGGESWKKLAGGLPEGIVGNVGVAVSPADPSRAWALVEAEKGGLFRSDDAGTTWKRVNESRELRQRAWYYTKVFAHPKNPDVVFVVNVKFWKSIDGGKSFTKIATPHGDHHALWIDPDDPERMIEGDDGGATITNDGGKTWSPEDTQPTAQIYRVTTDDRFPYWIYGSQQDSSSVAIPSRVRGPQIERGDWHAVGGGESGWVAPKPSDPNIVYNGDYGGTLTRYDHRTGETRAIMAWPQLIDGQAPRDLKYRFAWNAPIVLSPHDPETVYHAAQKLLRSVNGGQSWEEASPDLTRNDPKTQDYSGGPITKEMTGIEVYGTIFYVAFSRNERDVIWCGTDDGRLHVTRDATASWKEVTPKEMPRDAQVNGIEVSPHDPQTVTVAATRYKLDDFRPYLYRTTDGGATWARIDKGIPEGAFTRAVREDPERRGLLYCGTEAGLYVSFDAGASWQPFRANLPAVPITDLAVKNGDLILATQGRSFWILDDLAPLRRWSDELQKSPVALLPPSPSVRYPAEQDPDEAEEDEGTPTAGKNRPDGVLLDIWLRDKPAEKEAFKLEILEGEKVLRTFESEKKDGPDENGTDKAETPDRNAKGDKKEKPLKLRQGLNRFLWNMRMLKPELLPKAVLGDYEMPGPKVVPGTYRARLTAAGRTLVEPFEIRPNPVLKVPVADLAAQAALLRKLRDGLEDVHAIAGQIRDAKAQSAAIGARAEKAGKGKALAEMAKALAAKLTPIELKLVNPKIEASQDSLNFKPGLDHHFAWVAQVAGAAESKPTDANEAYAEEIRLQLEAVKKEWLAAQANDVAAFNKAVTEAGVPPVLVGTAKPGS